ncbi:MULTISPECIES: ATP-binding protein [Sorangium]|uniref:histidine kinase n=1 Tax=Sorangium cellulosum (strain So ce56) TaxID=448385 RepID=A9GVE6_SORC5|nr:ATP-binding protein [Sorangium cellulosum]CAN90746.1 two-component hybrid sensor and regulator [Sorangium cellulosum So ce56]
MSTAGSRELDALRARVAELERELAHARASGRSAAARGPDAPARDPGSARGSALVEQARRLLDEGEQAAQMGNWLWELGQSSIIWSRQLFRILGRDPETDTPSTETFLEAVHPDDRERLRAGLLLANETGEGSGAIAFRVRHRDGTVRECLLSSLPLVEGAGPPSRFFGAVVDLTERRRAEQELRRSERMLKEAQRIAHVGSWSYDIASRTIRWSEELYHILGVDPSVRPTFELFAGLIHPEDRHRVFGGAETASPLGIASPVECRVVRPSSGELRHVQMAAQLVTDDAGTITGLVGTSLDITERRRLEEQLLHSQKLEAIGRLAGGVAHDFNNMLTAIFGHRELAVRKVPAASPVAEHLTQIGTAAERAAALTRQLLAFARKQLIQPTVVDPNALILGVEPLLRPLVGEDVELVVLPGSQIWPIHIDRGQFEQLLMNLAVNARDAMPGGGRLVIETANRALGAGDGGWGPEIEPGDYVELTVTDTGQGIDDAVQKYVFEPFFTTKEPGKGSGLGLATCHGIVKQHGGHIGFASAPGQGTRFTICFPRVRGVPSEQPARATAAAVGGVETVLVVEDEAQVRELCVAALRSFGYSVLAARSGKEAIALAAAYPGPIHLLVSDVVLPDARGPALSAMLARARAPLPVLYASGYTEDALLQTDLLDGVAHFLAKPYTPTQLAKAVRAVLDASAQARRAKGSGGAPPPAPTAERLQ